MRTWMGYKTASVWLLGATVLGGCVAAVPKIKSLASSLGWSVTAPNATKVDGYSDDVLSGISLKCAGSNSDGQLGLGSFDGSSHSSFGLGSFKGQIFDGAGGANFTCVVNYGEVMCWGQNGSGESGLPANTPPMVLNANKVAGTDGSKNVTAGAFHACSLNVAGNVTCWGTNTANQLGDGTSSGSHVAVLVTDAGGSPLKAVNAVKSKQDVTCAKAPNGANFDALYCWGDNSSSQRGVSSAIPANRANIVPAFDGSSPGSKVAKFAVGQSHVCVVDQASNSLARCWGSNLLQQFPGASGTTPQNFAVSGSNSILEIEAGKNFTCAVVVVSGNNQVFCWGENANGQLGRGNLTNSNTPQAVILDDTVTPLSNVDQIYLGWNFACATTTTKKLYCWGQNSSGQLGNGSVADKIWATEVPGYHGGMFGVIGGMLHACTYETADPKFSWPAITNASSYEVKVKNALGTVVCPSLVTANTSLEMGQCSLQGEITHSVEVTGLSAAGSEIETQILDFLVDVHGPGISLVGIYDAAGSTLLVSPGSFATIAHSTHWTPGVRIRWNAIDTSSIAGAFVDAHWNSFEAKLGAFFGGPGVYSFPNTDAWHSSANMGGGPDPGASLPAGTCYSVMAMDEFDNVEWKAICTEWN